MAADVRSSRTAKDWGAAREHAQSLTGIRGENERVLPFNAPVEKLGRGGVGVVLLFKTTQWLQWLFGACAIASLPCLAHNIIESRPDADKHSYIVQTTLLFGVEDATLLLALQAIPWAVQMSLVLAFGAFLRAQQRRVAQSVDTVTITTGDYALEVRGLAPDRFDEAELSYFFADVSGGPIAQLEVAYTCEQFARVRVQLERLTQTIVDLGADAEADGASEWLAERRADLNSRVQIEGAELRALQQAKSPTGTAFVVFEYARHRDACRRKLEPPWYVSVVDSVPCLRGRIFDAVPRMGGHRVRVGGSPDPSDVFWENLEVTRCSRVRRSALVLLASALLISASFAILFTMETQAKAEAQQRLGSASTGSVVEAHADTGVTVAAAIVVTGINGLLKFISPRLAASERRSTRSEVERSVLGTLGLAYVINQSLLVLMISSTGVDGWAGNGNSFEKAFFICAANAVLPELVKVIRPDMRIKRLVGGLLAWRQEGLLRAHEPPHSQLGALYAALLRTVSLAVIFGPVVPLVWPLSIVALALASRANRYVLLRITSRHSPALGDEVSERFRELMPWLVGASLVVQMIAITQMPTSPPPASSQLVVVLSLCLWGAFTLLPYHLLPCCRAYEEGASSVVDDTRGRAFSEVAAEQGLQRFECPVNQSVDALITRLTKPRSFHFSGRPSASSEGNPRVVSSGPTPAASAGQRANARVAPAPDPSSQPTSSGDVAQPHDVDETQAEATDGDLDVDDIERVGADPDPPPKT